MGKRCGFRKLRVFASHYGPRLLLITSFCVVALLQSADLSHAAEEISQFFPQTGYTVQGSFLDYWKKHGGLFTFGYPITAKFEEDGYQVQYFERTRFEYHPENIGTQYEVLLGLLGKELGADHDFEPVQTGEGGVYFPQVHHTIRGGFLTYWNQQGGLSRFGLPISEEFDQLNQSDRHTYRVQYFERALFEYHPENNEPYRVLLGHLGTQMLLFRQHAAHFVQVLGEQLVVGAPLRPLKLKGFNYYPRDFAWTDFSAWSPLRVDFELQQAQALGANALRVFVRSDAFGGAGASWGEQTAFANFIKLAQTYKLYVLVSLFDGLRKEPNLDWDNWPLANTAQETQDKAYLTAIVAKWKDEPTIIGWDLYNEPDFVNGTEYQWEAHRQNRLDWLRRMAAELRRLDSNHLITIGVALADSNTLAAADASVLKIVDFVSVHYYGRNYRNQEIATVLNALRQQTHKPILLEEAGQATSPDSGTETEQAHFVEQMLQAVVSTDTSGVLIWTLYDWPSHANGSEGFYGVLRANDTAKPAAEIFRLGVLQK